VSPLDVKLLVEPATFAMADRPHVGLGYQVTNRSTSVIDAKAWEPVLLVNGQPSMAWSMSVYNSGYEIKWHHLPPHQTVSAFWLLGNALFETPGDYHLALLLVPHANVDVDDLVVESTAHPRSTVDVRVTP
jgi:hypothetical protein